MKKYIFLTTEGHTFQPGSETDLPDIENCQVLGYGTGNNAKDALKDMVNNNDCLLDTKFSSVIGIEIKSYAVYLSLDSIRNKRKR